MTGKPLDQKDRIEIILEEYKTLRSELIQRHTAIMQILGFATTVSIAVIGFAFINESIAAAVVGTFVLFAPFAVVLLIMGDTRLLSEHIQGIEREINSRAKDKLLSWDSTQGIEHIGYAKRLRRAWESLRGNRPHSN